MKERLMNMLRGRSTSDAGAGRGRVNPPMAREENPADARIRAAVEEARRERERERMGRAYDKAMPNPEYKKGGCVKKYAKGGSVRGDGCAQRGKTKGTMR